VLTRPQSVANRHLRRPPEQGTLQPIEFHYIAGPIRLENDSYTIVAHMDIGNNIVAGGVRYQLVDLHYAGEDAVRD